MESAKGGETVSGCAANDRMNQSRKTRAGYPVRYTFDIPYKPQVFEAKKLLRYHQNYYDIKGFPTLLIIS